MDRPTVAGLAGVVLYADRADDLARWYEKYLGLFFTREPDSHAWWCTLVSGTTFAIHQSRHALGNERRLCELSWRVTDLDAMVEYLADQGLAVDERQETTDGDFAWFNDPEGNRIELHQRPTA